MHLKRGNLTTPFVTLNLFQGPSGLMPGVRWWALRRRRAFARARSDAGLRPTVPRPAEKWVLKQVQDDRWGFGRFVCDGPVIERRIGAKGCHAHLLENRPERIFTILPFAVLYMLMDSTTRTSPTFVGQSSKSGQSLIVVNFVRLCSAAPLGATIRSRISSSSAMCSNTPV